MRCLTVGSGSPTSSSKHDWAKQMIEYKNHVGVVDNRWYNKLTFYFFYIWEENTYIVHEFSQKNVYNLIY